MFERDGESLVTTIRWFGIGHAGAGLALSLAGLASVPKWWHATSLVLTSNQADVRDYGVIAAWLLIKLSYLLQVGCGVWVALLWRGAWHAIMTWAGFACLAHAAWLILVSFQWASLVELSLASLTIVVCLNHDVRRVLQNPRGTHAGAVWIERV